MPKKKTNERSRNHIKKYISLFSRLVSVCRVDAFADSRCASLKMPFKTIKFNKVTLRTSYLFPLAPTVASAKNFFL